MKPSASALVLSTPARLDRAIDQLMTVLDLPARPKPEDVFNGNFLPDVKDRLFDR